MQGMLPRNSNSIVNMHDNDDDDDDDDDYYYLIELQMWFYPVAVVLQ
jgi:hypothetical protein